MSEEKKPNFVGNDSELESPELVAALDEVPLWTAPFGRLLLEMTELRPNVKVLDIGYGTGFPVLELAMRLGAGSHVYGIDPWDAGTERAKRKAEVYGITNVSFTNATAEQIPFEDAFFDMGISNNGINNVRDVKTSFEEISRVLKPGSPFLFTMNTNGTFSDFYDLYRKVLRDMGLSEFLPAIDAHIYEKRMPDDEVFAHARGAGFTVEEIQRDQFNYRFANGTAMLNHFFIRIAFLGPWRQILPEAHRDAVFAKLEEELNLAKGNDGLRYAIPFFCARCRKQ